MQKLSNKKKALTAVATLAVVGLGTGTAYAYWSGNGTSVGSATTSTTTDFTVMGGTTPSGLLIPGGGSVTVPFTVSNTGTSAAKLTAVTVTVQGSGGSTWTPAFACSALDYVVGAVTITPGEIPAGSKLEGTVALTMTNRASVNQDGCKNAVVPLYFVTS